MKPHTAAVVASAEHDYESHRAELIFNGSDGGATRALYDELAALGPLGFVAIQLFRAQKSSARAKVYHRGRYSTLAYGRKNWSLEQLAALLTTTNAQGEPWGGVRVGPPARDPWVLTVVLPDGHVRVTTTDALGYAWGWGPDATHERYPWVLYVDLPQGQVSFHAVTRGLGPDYAGQWDGIVDASTGRILRFVNAVLHPAPPPPLTLVEPPSESPHDQPAHQARSPRGRRPQRRVSRSKRSR